MRILNIFVIGTALLCTVDTQYTAQRYSLSFIRSMKKWQRNVDGPRTYFVKFQENCPKRCSCYKLMYKYGVKIKCDMVPQVNQTWERNFLPWMMLV